MRTLSVVPGGYTSCIWMSLHDLEIPDPALVSTLFISLISVLQHSTFSTLEKGLLNSGGSGGGQTGENTKQQSTFSILSRGD